MDEVVKVLKGGSVVSYTIKLPDAYHELNTPARGYLEDVEISWEDGRSCKLTFLDPHNKEHYSFYFEGQHVIILPEVSAQNIEDAVRKMSEDGSLDELQRGA
jgi:hypothetical protein